MSKRQERVRDLVLGAMELEAAQRSAWLRQECSEDPALLREVLSILDVETGGFLKSPIVAMDPAELVGRTLGSFRLMEVIGRGGMGVVFRARQNEPERDVAIKVLRAFAGEEGLRRFEVEIRAAAKLDHPSIVRVITSGSEGDTRWYAMDLVQGSSFEDLVRAAPEKGPDSETVARLMVQLLRALDHAHGRRVIHRDVKPANVLVDGEGRVRLTDFGLARDLDRTGISRSDQVAGTLAYMSPEQARALKDAVDWRTDVYSAGAVMFALLAGGPPHSGSTGAEVISQILNAAPVPLRAIRPDVDRGLATICDTALRQVPEERYPSAEAMADDLERWLSGDAVEGRPLTLRERAQRLRLPRRSLALLIPAAAASAAGASIGWVSWRRSRAGRVEVTLDLGPEDVGATLVIQPTDGFLAPGPATEVGRYHRPGTRLSIPQGRARLSAILGDRWVTFDRPFFKPMRLVGRCTPAPQAGSDPSWAQVNKATVEVLNKLVVGDQGVQEILTDIDVPPFSVQRALVSQGEFRADAQARGQWSSPPLDKRLIAATSGFTATELRRWDALPATRISLHEALAYAERRGLRLLTSPEWNAALEGGDGSWLRLSGANPFRVGFDDDELSASEQETLPAFAARAAAVDDDRYQLGPLGLFHPFGNVAEWTTSPGPMPSVAGGELPDFVATRGRSWFSKFDPVNDPPERALGLAQTGSSQWSVGFRCAKSASAPG